MRSRKSTKGRAGLLAALLAALSALAAAADEAPEVRKAVSKVETGFLYERYSIPSDGGVWWANASVPVQGGWSALLGAEHVRRFEKKDASGLFGAAWRGKKNGGYLQMRMSPGAEIVPRLAGEGVWDQGLRQGLYAEATLRVSDYVPARVYAQSLGLYWWPSSWAEVLGQGTATTTEFRRGATVTKPGVKGLANLFLRGEDLRLTPAISYYEEPFEAGAPGAVGEFHATVYHLGMGLRLRKRWELKLDAEYEARSARAYVRRGQAAVSYKF